MNGRKIKSILPILNSCIVFAPLDTPDTPGTHTKKTRTTSVIYSQHTTDYSKILYHKSTHHDVFFSIEIRDINPCASPEGAKRLTPREDDAAVERNPRCRHAAKGIELGTPRNSQAPQSPHATEK